MQTGYSGTVSVALGTGPSGAGLGGTLSVSVVAGVATFSDLHLNTAAGAYTLAISSPNLPTATTGSFAVVPAAPSQLVILTPPPASITDGQDFGMMVAVEDAFGSNT